MVLLLHYLKEPCKKTPLLANNQCCIVDRTDTVSNKIIIRGTRNDGVWREDSFEGIRAYYEKVPIGKMSIFDKVLDDLSVLKIKK